MLRTISNGQSIHQYIPPDLRRTFYKNPAAISASQNGKDPYGFSTDGLVLYLPLWALKDSAFKSVDRYRHTATVTTASWGTTGYTFDGAADFISIATTGGDALDITARPMSAFAWIKPTVDQDGYILCKNLDAAANVQYGYYWDAGANAFINVYLEGAQRAISVADSAPLNVWSLVGFTWIADGTIQIYVNGAASGAAGNWAAALTSRPNLNVGRRAVGIYFGGTIGEEWLYNRALSAVEIARQYNATAWRYQ